jgi:mRNA interferase MazF
MKHGKIYKRRYCYYPIPFSDLSGSKRRPAFVLVPLPGEDDIILCQITSKAAKDKYSITLPGFRWKVISGLTGSLQPIKKLFFAKPGQLIPSLFQKL